MTIKTYVCLDSNVLFRFVTQATPKFEDNHWRKLCQSVKDEHCSLIVPEVIILELDKLLRNLNDDFTSAVGKLEKQIGQVLDKKEFWNEIFDISDAITGHLKEWKKNKQSEMSNRSTQLRQLLKSSSVSTVPYDHNIHFSGHRRFIAGTFPKNPKKEKESRNYEDCCIIESLVEFFKGDTENKQLLFATENYQDFGIDVTDEQTTLHPLLTPGLPPTDVFKNLEKLVQFLEEKRPVEKPSLEALKVAIVKDKKKKAMEEEADAPPWHLFPQHLTGPQGSAISASSYATPFILMPYNHPYLEDIRFDTEPVDNEMFGPPGPDMDMFDPPEPEMDTFDPPEPDMDMFDLPEPDMDMFEPPEPDMDMFEPPEPDMNMFEPPEPR